MGQLKFFILLRVLNVESVMILGNYVTNLPQEFRPNLIVLHLHSGDVVEVVLAAVLLKEEQFLV